MTAERQSEDSLLDEDTIDEPYDEITLTEPELPHPGSGDDDQTPVGLRDVRILDFRDGSSGVTVSHGPIDPSRVWIAFKTPEAYLHLSLEEGVVRRLDEGLRRVLKTFAEVRSAVHSRGGTR